MRLQQVLGTLILDQGPVTRRGGATLLRIFSFGAELQYAAHAAVSLRRFSSASLRR